MGGYVKAPRTARGFLEAGLGFGGYGLGCHFWGSKSLRVVGAPGPGTMLGGLGAPQALSFLGLRVKGSSRGLRAISRDAFSSDRQVWGSLRMSSSHSTAIRAPASRWLPLTCYTARML